MTISTDDAIGKVTTSCHLGAHLADVLLGTPDLLSDTALARIRPSTTAENRNGRDRTESERDALG